MLGLPDERYRELKQESWRYQALWAHATGGLGDIFIAEDGELQRRVALKVIQAHHARNPVSRERFMSEAEITGNLEHPGIVPVYGLGSYTDGRPCYAMRFIKGENLATAARRFHTGASPDFQGASSAGSCKGLWMSAIQLPMHTAEVSFTAT